jgi:hypothetical protein
LLKKPNLDKEMLKNYRPVSNLPFISKILEKVANNQLVHEIRFKPQQSIFGNASGIFQTIEKYLMVNDIKRCQ